MTRGDLKDYLRGLVAVAVLLAAAGPAWADAFPPSVGGGGGGLSVSTGCALTGCTMTGAITFNTAGGTDAAMDEVGIDRASGSATTFNIINSGAGAMTLQVDGATVWNAGNDGAASTLDADLLDGVSSAAFALVAGGNTFASSNTYAANDITDADVVDTITASSYLLLAGGTMTGDIVSGAGVDIGIGTTPTERLHISGVGTQRFIMDETGSTVQLKSVVSTTQGFIGTSTAHPFSIGSTDGNVLTIGTGHGANTRVNINSTEFVINDSSQDYDFRVEADTNPNMIVVDGTGAGAVGIGIANTTAGTLLVSLPLTFSAVTTDITSAGDADLNLDVTGAGIIQLQGPTTVTGATVINGVTNTTILTAMASPMAAAETLDFRWGEVDATDQAGVLRYINGDGVSGNSKIQLFNGGNTAATSGITLVSVGQVGIGTATPAGRVDINNGAIAESILIARDNGTAAFTIADGGNITATGTYTGPVGSTSATSYAFVSDPNTGMYSAGADSVSLVAGGTEVMKCGGGQCTQGAGTAGMFAIATTVGDATTATYGFASDGNTGMFRIGADELGFTAGGTQRLSLDATDLVSTVFVQAPRFHNTTAQSVACAANVLALTPTSTTVYLDANADDCVITVSEPAATFLNDVINIVVFNLAVANAVTFPNSANVIDGPTLCHTTGFNGTAGATGVYSLVYADLANDTLIGQSCTQNL